MRLNWVTLHVSDMEKSMHFYSELLGLETAAKFGPPEHQIVMLGKEDSAKVELIYEPGKSVDNPGNGVSTGLECPDLDGMVEKLKANGLDVVGPIAPNPHIRFFFVKDPDGYTIQLVEQK